MAMTARGYPANGYRSGSAGYGGFQKPGTAPRPGGPAANDNFVPPPSPANDNYVGSPRTPFDTGKGRPGLPAGIWNPRTGLPGGGIDTLGSVSTFWEVYRNSNEFAGYNMAGYDQVCFFNGGGSPSNVGDYCQLSFILQPPGYVVPAHDGVNPTVYFTENTGPWNVRPNQYDLIKTRSQWYRTTAPVGPLTRTEPVWWVPSSTNGLGELPARNPIRWADIPGQEASPATDRGYSRASAYAASYATDAPASGRTAWDRSWADRPGFTFTYDDLGGVSAPPRASAGTMSPPQPPKRGREKEKKIVLLPGGSGAFGRAARRVMNILTESTDFLDALWTAIPEEFRGKRNKRVSRKAQDVWDYWDKIDWSDAILNLAKNQLEDKVIGTLGSKASKGFGGAQERYFGRSGRSIGITTGPAL